QDVRDQLGAGEAGAWCCPREALHLPGEHVAHVGEEVLGDALQIGDTFGDLGLEILGERGQDLGGLARTEVREHERYHLRAAAASGPSVVSRIAAFSTPSTLSPRPRALSRAATLAPAAPRARGSAA